MTKGVPGLLSALAIAVLIAALPAVAADPNKVLHVAFVAPENGFDPQATGDLYSNYVNRQIFDSLYRYDYLARPYKVIPNTAAGLPEISSDGLTWTIKVRPGIYFTDDAAFKGKKRELAAADYVYSWKRLLDPKLRSINAQIFDDRLVGAKAAIEAAKKTGKFDYDAAFEGAQAVDRYTIRLKLNYPAYDLLGDLTSSGAAAVAREVVTAYGDPSGWVMEHPVGHGSVLFQVVAAGAAGRSRGQPRLPRAALPRELASRRSRDVGRDARQEAPGHRAHRDRNH